MYDASPVVSFVQSVMLMKKAFLERNASTKANVEISTRVCNLQAEPVDGVDPRPVKQH